MLLTFSLRLRRARPGGAKILFGRWLTTHPEPDAAVPQADENAETPEESTADKQARLADALVHYALRQSILDVYLDPVQDGCRTLFRSPESVRKLGRLSLGLGTALRQKYRAKLGAADAVVSPHHLFHDVWVCSPALTKLVFGMVPPARPPRDLIPASALSLEQPLRDAVGAGEVLLADVAPLLLVPAPLDSGGPGRGADESSTADA